MEHVVPRSHVQYVHVCALPHEQSLLMMEMLLLDGQQ